MALPAKVRLIVLWEDVKRVYAEMSPSDALTKDIQTTEEQERSATRHYETLKTRTRRFREEMTTMSILGFADYEEKPVCWWTGKPLRAFPHTTSRRRKGSTLTPQQQSRSDFIREWISRYNEDALLAEGFDEAIIGVAERCSKPALVVYDIERCIKVLMERDGMDRDGAVG